MDETEPPSFCSLATPIGPLVLVGDGDGRLREIRLPRGGKADPPLRGLEDRRPLQRALAGIEAYFEGKARDFSLPLAPSGTLFQLAVWRALQSIPYGETETYAGLARRLGRDKAARAVGAANRRNPLPLVVPCHRVIGADGSLTGYAGGLEAKAWLLRHEARVSGRPLPELPRADTGAPPRAASR